MSYIALYRKFRPPVFDDVKGQDHIVTTLKNQIKSDRVGHAYLFCGTRGTGKTSVAKIMAKAVNCEHPVDGNPCGECASCKAIAEGNSMNVVEIDAASNNSVDNIRQIISDVEYSPTQGKYRVYIIDEVHMLSAGAFNALLKTLEEPPSYVIFILATTEVQKIPVTILSRCQRYDFRRITVSTIEDRLREVVTEEKIDADEKALRYIARSADGAMRDGLSLLDECIAFNYGEKLTYDKVIDVLGAVDTEVFSRLYDNLADGDVGKAIDLLSEVVIQGRELSQFVNDFIWYLRNMMLSKASNDAEDAIDISSENLETLKKQASSADMNTIIRYINIFSELSSKLRFGAQKRILIEMTFIRLCRPEMDSDNTAVLDRLRKLETDDARTAAVIKKIETGQIGVGVYAKETPVNTGAGEATPAKALPKAVTAEIQTIVDNWNSILDKMSGIIRHTMSRDRITTISAGTDGRLYIGLGNSTDASSMNAQKHDIEATLEQRIGKSVEVEIAYAPTESEAYSEHPDIRNSIKMDIDYEDDDDNDNDNDNV